MNHHLAISREDAWRIYELIEELHDFLHKPENLSTPEDIQTWLSGKGVYPELREVYYRVVAQWFPVNEETGIVEPPPGVRRRFSNG